MCAQEWATGNNIVLPHRETRPNAAQVFKWEEESPGPTSNILQVHSHPVKAATDNGPLHMHEEVKRGVSPFRIVCIKKQTEGKRLDEAVVALK